MELNKAEDGGDFFKMMTDSKRETNGVHLLIAPYIGIFIPCRAERESVVCSKKHTDAGNTFFPS